MQEPVKPVTTITPPAAVPKPPSWAVGMGHEADMEGEKHKRIPFRFWVEKGKTRPIVFITDGNTAPVIYEHQYQAVRNAKLTWGHNLTCLKLIGKQCPMCDFADEMGGKYSRSKVQLFTILDMTPWEDKDKKAHLFTKRVLAVKKQTQEIIARRYIDRLDENQTLRGALYNVFRSNDDKSAAAGTEYQFKKMVDLSTFPEGATDEVDWELFAPDPEVMVTAVNKIRQGHGLPMLPGTAPVAGASYTEIAGGPIMPDSELAEGPASDIEIPY